ncbi:long-chain-fatty-acid--CoA ligase [Mesobacterium pallidum]|uniref:long-chain-fatty-acid--CoA ligase n=1 Tax=Mesobacterium pallidum TaxID=2872037 RepID=UPI001EE1FC80|nr:long-chain-fatty-acid--CoA ligase [Mesobacterium pallidum]
MQLTNLLRRCLQTNPDGIAVIERGVGRTWRDTADTIARAGRFLITQGVAPGDRVAVLALNSTTFFDWLFAVPWVGAAIVPLNTRWSLEELVHALRDCGAQVLAVDHHFADLAQGLRREIPGLTLVHTGHGPCPVGMEDYAAQLPDLAPADEWPGGEDALWGILYTGGTTGHPKGVMLSHRNLFISAMFWMIGGGIGRSTRYLHIAGFFHIVSTMPVFAVTMTGGTHVIEDKFEPVATMRAIERERTNFATFVPTMLSMMLNHPRFGEFDLTSMGRCIYGGSPIPDILIEGMIDNLPTWEFIQGYGQTETTGILTTLPWADHFGEGEANKRTATGRPIPGVTLRLVDETGRDTPLGETGEIVVRGGNVMLGYWNNPGATADTIRDGWLHTGDLARMDARGFLTIVGRSKDMIVTGGENVFSTEVENAVTRHPAVQDCAVFGIPSKEWGESVHAVVILKAGHDARAEDIMAFCRDRIAGYKCPRSLSFTDAFPMSAAGKVQKGVLRAPYWQGHEKQVG